MNQKGLKEVHFKWITENWPTFWIQFTLEILRLLWLILKKHAMIYDTQKLLEVFLTMLSNHSLPSFLSCYNKIKLFKDQKRYSHKNIEMYDILFCIEYGII